MSVVNALTLKAMHQLQPIQLHMVSKFGNRDYIKGTNSSKPVGNQEELLQDAKRGTKIQN